MAYVDHAFSITDDDDLIGGAVGGPRGAPVKEIAFAAALLAFGALGVVAGLLMAANRVGGDRAHGMFSIILGIVMFCSSIHQYMAFKLHRPPNDAHMQELDTSPFRWSRNFLYDSGHCNVHPWLLLHKNSILCLQRIQGLLVFKHPTHMKKRGSWLP